MGGGDGGFSFFILFFFLMVGWMDVEEKGLGSVSGSVVEESVRVESELYEFLKELDSTLRKSAKDHEREIERMEIEQKILECEGSIELILSRVGEILRGEESWREGLPG